MLRLILNKKILAISLCLLSTLVSADDIGDIVEHSGSSGIVRDGTKEVILGAVDEDIFFKDSIETATGRMKIVFVDDTSIRFFEGLCNLVSHSSIYLL